MPNETRHEKTIEKIFDKLDDQSEMVATILERTEHHSEQIRKFDNCISDIKKILIPLQVEMGKLETRLSLKTGFIAILCSMIPPAIAIILLIVKGVI